MVAALEQLLEFDRVVLKFVAVILIVEERRDFADRPAEPVIQEEGFLLRIFGQCTFFARFPEERRRLPVGLPAACHDCLTAFARWRRSAVNSLFDAIVQSLDRRRR